MSLDDLEETCLKLSSTKERERKKAISNLCELLDEIETLELLNSHQNGRFTWNDVVRYTHILLVKESDRLHDLVTKKGQKNCNHSQSSHLLLSAVKHANHGSIRLNVQNLLQYCLQCFTSSTLSKYFLDTYINILRENVLPEPSYQGHISPEDWLSLLEHLKRILLQSEHNNSNVAECLKLILKYGPLHKFPIMEYRAQFSFMTELCHRLNSSLPSRYIFEVLQATIEFIEQNSDDCCMSCCKFGEDVFTDIYGLYVNNSTSKEPLFEFFLLQIKLHHTKGADESSEESYAHSWHGWKKQLRAICSVVDKEFSNYIKSDCKDLIQSNGKKESVLISLAVEVYKQIFTLDFSNITQVSSLESTCDVTQPLKRQKLDGGFRDLLNSIQQTKRWVWIYVTTAVLEKYPDIIDFQTSLQLMETLITLRKDIKNSDVERCIYQCLAAVLNVQHHNPNETNESEKMWDFVSDTVIRSIGLNINAEAIHKLLKMLIIQDKIKDPSIIYQTYTSGAVALNKYSLETLAMTIKRFDVPDKINGDSFKHKIFEWVMNCDEHRLSNMDVFQEEILVKILVNLCLKQWTLKIDSLESQTNVKPFENIYLLNSFKELILMKPNEKIEDKGSSSVKYDVLFDLMNCLENFTVQFMDVRNDKVYMRNLCIVTIFISNFVTYLNDYVPSVEVYIERLNLERMFATAAEIAAHHCRERISEARETFLDVMKSFNKLLSRKFLPVIIDRFLLSIPIEFLRDVFDLKNLEDDQEDVRVINESSLHLLCNFCMNKSSISLTEAQEQTLMALSAPNFDPEEANDCRMEKIFFSYINTCPVGTLGESAVSLILDSLEKVCDSWITEYHSVLDILNALHHLIPHLRRIDSNYLYEKFYRLLFQFFDFKNNYGRYISIKLIKCIESIIQENGYLNVKMYTNTCITWYINEFLKSTHQSVRIEAIYCLLVLFGRPSNEVEIRALQQSIVSGLNDTSQEVFKIEGCLDDERKIDESVVRTASVLHTYGSLIVSSSVWRKKLLFSMLIVVQEKKLTAGIVNKLLDLVVRELKYPTKNKFFSQFIDSLLAQWHSNKRSIDNFPFRVLECYSAFEFYNKYIKTIVPLMFQCGDIKITESKITEIFGLTIPEVLQTCYLELTTLSFLKMAGNAVSSKFGNVLYSTLVEHLSQDKVDELLLENLDKIVVNVMKVIVDVPGYKEQFGVEYELEIGEYPGSCIFDVIDFIKIKAKISADFFKHSLAVHPQKVQKMLLSLTEEVYEQCSIEDQLKSLHRFLKFIEILTPHLKPNLRITDFCIRSIIHNLLHFIESNGNAKLNLASCRYLQQFLRNIIPHCSNDLTNFLSIIVNKIVPLILNCDLLSEECIALLKMLILEYGALFNTMIPNLDPLPQHDELVDINAVYKKLRYEKWTTSLEDEIKHFLQAGSGWNICRLEALKHLRKQLTDKKRELQELLERTREVRDFLEDRKCSIIHNLICMLVQMTSSNDSKVSVEATYCLGELGPADLSTLILQSEDTNVDKVSSPLQLFTSHVITHLYYYIIDTNIEIVKNASDVLYKILSTKEGQYFLKNCDNKINVSYLFPFETKRNLHSTVIEVNKNDFLTTMGCDELFWSNKEHKDWISHLVISILKCFSDECYLKSLIPLCRVNVSFCDVLLPHLLHLLTSLNAAYAKILSTRICYYFDNVWEMSINCAPDSVERIQSTRCMLKAVHFSRVHGHNLKNSCQLVLDDLKIAQAALYCSHYFVALFYVELWCQNAACRIPEEKKFSSSGMKILDLIYKGENPDNCKVAQNILRQSYTAIGEFDALNGCGRAFLKDTSTKIEHYKQLEKWNQVVLQYDTLLSQGNRDVEVHFVTSLKNSGFYQLASNYTTEVDYECLWRLSRYDAETAKQSENCFEKYTYDALKALPDNDDELFCAAVCNARQAVIESTKKLNLEATKPLYNALTKLQMVQEVEDLYDAQGGDVVKVFGKWKAGDRIVIVDFKSIEPIKAQRIAALTRLFQNGREEFKKPLAKCYLDLAGSARAENYFNVAQRAVENLNAIPDLDEKYSFYNILEEAQICWAMNNKQMAFDLIEDLVTDKNNNTKLKFASLKLYGQWMAASHAENSKTILQNYFLQPLDLMKNVEKTGKDYDKIFETYHDIARYSDVEYQRIRSYVKSSEFEQKIKNKEKLKYSADKIKTQGGSLLYDQRKAMCFYQKQSLIDEAEINNTLKERSTYFLLAVKYYMLNLQFTDLNNIQAFRVLSLWLENRNSEDLEKLLIEIVPKIPSYKFVSILPQLVPHLSNTSKDKFGNCISSIIERCAKEHPHHTLPILMFLSNSNMDEEYSESSTPTENKEARILAAQALLVKLKKDPLLLNIINELQTVSEALVQLAYLEQKKCKDLNSAKKIYEIPKNMKIFKIRNLSQSYLPSCAVDVVRDGRYSNVISIRSFGNEFALVGGKSAPKRIVCKLSDGSSRRFLVKGQDDLRQDAVMQQVFTIMNDLFRSNKNTSKLLIRTYKVTPLSKRSGLIEWVEDSKVIGDFLYNLHAKYNPHDWSAERCKSKIQSVSGRSNEDKLKVYKDICLNFRPVMHKFFEEVYPHPSVWYERRRAFIHSVATSSMCGYILGLGDRHGHNILFDENTGEVIHIDFGIAFEQGKVLPTPETVPFRLTRDIVDGMGVSGVTGVFKRSCEKTMEVLRKNWQTIVSILEVLLYDPLYEWTITPEEAYSRQFSFEEDRPKTSFELSDEDRVNLNVTAERALLRLHQKLHGTEEGGSSSVEGQVEQLIQQARDPSNLSRLYVGWSAFL